MYRLDYVSFLGLTGYGQAARNNIAALLEDKNFDVKLTPLDLNYRKSINKTHQDYAPLIEKSIDRQRTLILHCIPDMSRRFAKNLCTLGWGTFETWEPPKHWIALLNQNDGCIVPSTFCKQILEEQNLVVPIFVIPHCLDVNIYHQDIKPMYSWKRFSFLFLGTWKKRKGYDLLLSAWQKAFSHKDNVQLVIKTDRPLIAQAEVRKNMSHGSAKIFVDPKRYSPEEMPNFIKSANCLVAPTLGEAFFFPGLEAMAVGIPVIISDHSGCREYATEDTAILLEPTGKKFYKTMDGIPQFSNKNWITLSEEELISALQNIFRDPAGVRKQVYSAASMVRERFSYSIARKNFQEMFDQLR